MSADAELLAGYIAGTVRSKDGRGVYRNYRACLLALLPNTTGTIALQTAAAVRAVGEAIAKRAAT